MAEKITGWKVGEQTFATKIEAERAEGRAALSGWFDLALRGAASEDACIADHFVERIQADPSRFVALLRAAGVPLIVRERKAKVAAASPPATTKRGAKKPEAAE